MQQVPDDFGRVTKEVRKQLSLSQEELAQALGVSFATVNRWENGRTTPSPMAVTVFKTFCKEQGEKLNLPGVDL
jgi:DNA-binding transcriptional regulator YiaG